MCVWQFFKLKMAKFLVFKGLADILKLVNNKFYRLGQNLLTKAKRNVSYKLKKKPNKLITMKN